MLNRRSLLKMAVGTTALTLIPTAKLLAQTPGKRLAMVFDVRRCTGCISCSVSCSIENQVPMGRGRTKVSQCAIEHSEGISTLSVPHQCNHCKNPTCVEVCPAKATYKRPEDGIVVIDYDKCIHCQRCVTACPYGARIKDPKRKAPPEKCNFCIHRLEQGLLPACVETCIGEARIFGDLNDPNSTIAKLVSENDVYGMLPANGNLPNILYIGLPTPSDDKKILKLSPLDWQR
ncbi:MULTISPECIES: 4Fe-4S dicluster domain-containing protein [unclassified Shewanella]|uniref:4Fe-4S dicluster domain-containing protein n=1 Tax=unclassified Shewanella TaxID=196818 RepID=UPI001BC75B53|nr:MULTISPECIES: 4Fe-4S dicluster domain-containing protein [unclassified Shewanella]GIU19937.1 tetrathionate reductase subunit B [Shewanella sp. MBTL60-112-B1]GIU34468.1 tetrathionate reductase subunit B [Shewanella sp. MBTL60-112-B2]